MKYKILNFLDLAGMKVFSPIVLLAYGEEPHVQLRKITIFIVMPMIFFFIFLGIWSYLAPRHTTKSGEVPTPSVVVDAATGVKAFHDREYQKKYDYLMGGEKRDEILSQVEARLAEIEPYLVKANQAFADARATFEKETEVLVAPLQDKYTSLRTQYKAAQTARKDALKAQGAAASEAARLAFVDDVRAHLDQTQTEKDELKALKADMNALRGKEPEYLKVAKDRKNRLGEEQQFLKKRQMMLGEGNRARKTELAQAKVEENKMTLATAEGDAVYGAAVRVIKGEQSLSRIKEADYAKPFTLIDQIIISLKCVGLGFLIASAIAIPIGVLCGLSNIFMACMTPLISLFKPVSPIVWLPIVFIVVGGFIDNPDTAAVKPAFLSSAITVALCSLWPTLTNTALGVASIEQDHINVAKVLRLGFWSRLFRIVIPSALPLIFAGLRISLGVGWMVLVAAELLSSSEGIGKFVWDMFNNGSSETFAQMFVVVFVVGVIGLALDRIMIIAQRLVSFDEAPTAI